MKKKSKLRIAKFISNAGISSRRGAEKLILEGKVEVNGQLIKSPALNINKDDIVKVNGRIIEYDLSVRMWIFYKPKGCLVTASDPKDRKTIYDILPNSMKNINAVGRLDFNSEGLLLLTNNGDFSRYLELPKNNFERLYKVRVFGKVRKDLLLGLSKGIKIDGIRYKPIKEIRKVCKSMNLEVNRLIRYSYGPFNLKKLEKGQIEEIPSFILKKKLPNFFKNKGN